MCSWDNCYAPCRFPLPHFDTTTLHPTPSPALQCASSPLSRVSKRQADLSLFLRLSLPQWIVRVAACFFLLLHPYSRPSIPFFLCACLMTGRPATAVGGSIPTRLFPTVLFCPSPGRVRGRAPIEEKGVLGRRGLPTVRRDGVGPVSAFVARLFLYACRNGRGGDGKHARVAVVEINRRFVGQ